MLLMVSFRSLINVMVVSLEYKFSFIVKSIIEEQAFELTNFKTNGHDTCICIYTFQARILHLSTFDIM